MRVCLAVLFLFSSLCFTLAQTSLDDIHIQPRQTIQSLRTGGELEELANNAVPLIRADVKLVLVPVSVTDPHERFVTGLDRSNFQVYEGKTQQAIQNFSQEDVPISIGIILDVSGSMGDKLERLRDAVNQFCEAANPQDEFFLITFSNEPRMVVDFTTSTNEIEKELVFVQPKGQTSLLDATEMGLRKMKDARYGKKALLVISDGGDNHSRFGERDVKNMARESDVMIYSIGVFDKYVPTPEEALGPPLLSAGTGSVSQSTGGEVR